MMGHMGWIVVVGVVVALLSTPWFVADSRDGKDWKPWAPPGADARWGDGRGAGRSPAVVGLRRLMRGRRGWHRR